MVFKKKNSADDTCYAVKSLALAISAFHCSYFRQIHPFSHPAFCAVGKRRGFHKCSPYPELTAMNAEPAVLNRFFFLRQALHPAFYCRKDPVLLFSYTHVSCCNILSQSDIIPVNDVSYQPDGAPIFIIRSVPLPGKTISRPDKS
jgi:hypothetical protein